VTDIIGSGLAFPLQVDRRGGIALAHDEQDIDQAIQLILGTAPGERPMRPEFGCGVHDFVFDTIDAGTVARMETAIRGALDRWEPRIEVLTVELSVERTTQGGVLDELVVIDIAYKLRATNDVRNLVYPFYVIPAEE
jgi:phage baseplate assembly protein W